MSGSDVSVTVPGDKSISHRALMLAALCEAPSQIEGILTSADVQATAASLRAMGAIIPPLAGTIEVRGRGLRGLREPQSPLDCANSGTTTRLLAGIAAAHPFVTDFIGDPSLSRRPMRRIAEPLRAMGAGVELQGGETLPMRVRGADLRPIGWTTPAASAQIKSAILLAALSAQIPSSVTEPRRSRDHTERMLQAAGVEIVIDGTTVSIAPARALEPLRLRVPGDPSSAAFLVALATLREHAVIRVEHVCLNPTRTGFLDVMQRMGCAITTEVETIRMGEPIGTIVARSAGLRGVTIGAAEIPSLVDELPAIAAAAARAGGETVVTGAAELRVKESDRIAAVVQNMRAIGVQAEELPDGFRIVGTPAPLRGHVRTHGDHRIAMAFGILGTLPGNEIEVDDPDCVAVSYPDFWRDVARAGA